MKKNIAIDGPAGAGKSTVAKKIAERLGLLYVDTGAMYRAIALKAKNEKINLSSEKDVTELAGRTEVELKGDRVFLNGKDVSREIRSPEISTISSAVSRFGGVRRRLVEIQRKLSKSAGVIMEGRDIGTVVLPDADFKFYLDASVKERAMRRLKELTAKGIEADFKQVEDEIRKRDEQDTGREIAPLKKAEDAIVIDSSNLTAEQVIGEILRHVGV